MKNFTSLFLSLSLCCALTSPALAISPPVTDAEPQVSAYLCAPDGEVLDVNITAIDTEIISPLTKANHNKGITYRSKVKVETKSDTLKSHGISASGSLSMTWTDVGGVENKINNLEGYFTVASGTFSTARVYYGSDYSAPAWAPYNEKVGKKFDFAVDYTSDDDKFGTVRADAIADIISPEDDREYQLKLCVVPSIFS